MCIRDRAIIGCKFKPSNYMPSEFTSFDWCARVNYICLCLSSDLHFWIDFYSSEPFLHIWEHKKSWVLNLVSVINAVGSQRTVYEAFWLQVMKYKCIQCYGRKSLFSFLNVDVFALVAHLVAPAMCTILCAHGLLLFLKGLWAPHPLNTKKKQMLFLF